MADIAIPEDMLERCARAMYDAWADDMIPFLSEDCTLEPYNDVATQYKERAEIVIRTSGLLDCIAELEGRRCETCAWWREFEDGTRGCNTHALWRSKQTKPYSCSCWKKKGDNAGE